MLIEKPKIVALIPLRGGSKSIPYKNIKIIAGKPLAYWTLKAAHESKYIQEVYVSTDDLKIARVIDSLNLGVKIIQRPARLATDKATSDAVMIHFASQVTFDLMFMIQATSPMTQGKDLDQAYEKFKSQNVDSMLTGTLLQGFIWKQNGIPLNYNPLKRPMRQEFTDKQRLLKENGAFYITKRKILKKYKCRLGGKIATFLMSEEAVNEIDEPKDWAIVEKILLARNNN